MNTFSRWLFWKVFRRSVTTRPCGSNFRPRLEWLEPRAVPALIHHWKLDEAVGNNNGNGAVADAVGAAGAATAAHFNGNAASGPSNVVPVLHFADPLSRKFDGGDDEVKTNNPINLSRETLTLAAWVRVSQFKAAAPNISTIAGIEELNGAQTALTDTALLRIIGLYTSSRL